MAKHCGDQLFILVEQIYETSVDEELFGGQLNSSERGQNTFDCRTHNKCIDLGRVNDIDVPRRLAEDFVSIQPMLSRVYLDSSPLFGFEDGGLKGICAVFVLAEGCTGVLRIFSDISSVTRRKPEAETQGVSIAARLSSM